MEHNSYIAVDWGTSNFRAYLLSKNGDNLEQISDNKGCKDLQTQEFEPFLKQTLNPWLVKENLPIILCGMVGSKIGWHEVPYLDIKDIKSIKDLPVTKVPVNDESLLSFIIHGLCQTKPHYDVMRGEETQIAGFIHNNPNISTTLVLPGTHSKWVCLNDGNIESFHTIMTGELFELLKQYSTLSPVLQGSDALDDEWFQKGFEQAWSNASSLSAALFNIRASSLLEPKKLKSPLSFLSGMLIGEEFKHMKKLFSENNSLNIIGSSKLSSIYQKVAQNLGYESQILNADEIIIKAIHEVYLSLVKKGAI